MIGLRNTQLITVLILFLYVPIVGLFAEDSNQLTPQPATRPAGSKEPTLPPKPASPEVKPPTARKRFTVFIQPN